MKAAPQGHDPALALGLTAYVFQDLLGHGELAFFVPVASAILLLALGADYNVFLVSRIWREAERRTCVLRSGRLARVRREPSPWRASSSLSRLPRWP
jgi:hypothetical protein